LLKHILNSLWLTRVKAMAVILFVTVIVILPQSTEAAPTTSLTIKKMAVDGKTVLAKKTIDYHWMMDPNNIPVMGDGMTHYYHQGPVFVDDPDPDTEEALRWNPAEDTNVREKDMGALMGTNVKDLCNLVGGMAEHDTLRIKAQDGLSKQFAYKNIYQYSSREGPMVISWYKDGQYPDSGFSDGMRLVWLADTSTNPWGIHVFGNWDWCQAAEENYWYYYQSGDEKYPTTTGLSVMFVNELIINSTEPVPEGPIVPAAGFKADKTSGYEPLTVNFTDQSANSPTSCAWDFDNDGRIDSTDKSPSYTFESAGQYSVKLTVNNYAGSDSEVKLDYIIVDPAKSNEVANEKPAPLEQEKPSPDTNKKQFDYAKKVFIPAMVIIALGLGIILLRKKDR